MRLRSATACLHRFSPIKVVYDAVVLGLKNIGNNIQQVMSLRKVVVLSVTSNILKIEDAGLLIILVNTIFASLFVLSMDRCLDWGRKLKFLRCFY